MGGERRVIVAKKRERHLLNPFLPQRRSKRLSVPGMVAVLYGFVLESAFRSVGNNTGRTSPRTSSGVR